MTRPAPAAPELFVDLDVASPRQDALGGKAASLLRLARAGLPTPPGFVVSDALYRALAADPIGAPLPPGFAPALAARLGALGATRFSVRSSFASEDQPGEVAAGIYQSRIDVAAAEVPQAIREVLQSAQAPAALAYAAARGQGAPAAPIAVLIHTHVAGTAHGGAALAPGRDVIIDVFAGAPSPAARAAITAAATTLVQRHGPIELEWVATGDAVTFLQLRPYAPPAAQPTWPGFAELPPGEPARRWSWDAAHNPLPLSRAHAGLVALVDATCRIGIRQRVLGGHLFWAADPDDVARTLGPGEVATTLAELIADATRDLRALPQPPTLEAALGVFLAHYQPLLGEVQPAARRARAELRDFLALHLPGAQLPPLLAEVESQAQVRRRLARRLAHAAPAQRHQARADYLAVFGDEATEWDSAAPTHREEPAQLQAPAPPAPRPSTPATWTHEHATLAARLAPAQAARLSALVTQARQAVAAGEDDDWLYARLQAPIRHAIRALGAQLVQAGALAAIDQAFDLELDTLRAFGRGETIAPEQIRAAAARGRALTSAARLAPPPLAEGGAANGVIRGSGCGGRAVGRVVLRHGPAGRHPPPDAVLVATSLLPTELPLLEVAALVTEAGGVLGHVATQARERGLPAVVGAAGAVALLRDGDTVLVDGDAGLVIKTAG